MITCHFFYILFATICLNNAEFVMSCSKPTSVTLAAWGTDDNFYHPDKKTPFSGPLQPGTYSLQCIVTPRGTANEWISVTCDSSDGEIKLVDIYAYCSCPFITRYGGMITKTSSSQYKLNCKQDTSLRYYSKTNREGALLKIKSPIVECIGWRSWKLKDQEAYKMLVECTKQCDRQSLNDDHTGIGKGVKDTLKVRSADIGWSRDELEPNTYVMSCTGTPKREYYVKCDYLGRLRKEHDCSCNHNNDDTTMEVPFTNGKITVKKNSIKLKCNDRFVWAVRIKPEQRPIFFRHDHLQVMCKESKWYGRSGANCDTDVKDLECGLRIQGDGQTIGATKVDKSRNITCATGYTAETTNNVDTGSQSFEITCKFKKNEDGTVNIQYDNLNRKSPPCMLSCTAEVNHGVVTTETGSGSPRHSLNCDVGYAQDVDVTCDSTAKKWKDADGNLADCEPQCPITPIIPGGSLSWIAGDTVIASCNKGFYTNNGTHNKYGDIAVYCAALTSKWKMWHNQHNARCEVTTNLECEAFYPGNSIQVPPIAIGGSHELNCGIEFDITTNRNGADRNKIKCVEKREENIVTAILEDNNPVCVPTLRCPHYLVIAKGNVTATTGSYTAICYDGYYIEHDSDKKMIISVSCESPSGIWVVHGTTSAAVCLDTKNLTCSICTGNSNAYKEVTVSDGKTDVKCESKFRKSVNGKLHESQHLSVACKAELNNNKYTTKVEPGNEKCQKPCQLEHGNFEIDDDEALGKLTGTANCDADFYMKNGSSSGWVWKQPATCKWETDDWKLTDQFGDSVECRAYTCKPHTSHNQDHVTHAYGTYDLQCKMGYLIAISDTVSSDAYSHRVTCSETRSGNKVCPVLSPNNIKCKEVCTASNHLQVGNYPNGTGWAKCGRGNYLKESSNRLWNTDIKVGAKCSFSEKKFIHWGTNMTLECVASTSTMDSSTTRDSSIPDGSTTWKTDERITATINIPVRKQPKTTPLPVSITAGKIYSALASTDMSHLTTPSYSKHNKNLHAQIEEIVKNKTAVDMIARFLTGESIDREVTHPPNNFKQAKKYLKLFFQKFRKLDNNDYIYDVMEGIARKSEDIQNTVAMMIKENNKTVDVLANEMFNNVKNKKFKNVIIREIAKSMNKNIPTIPKKLQERFKNTIVELNMYKNKTGDGYNSIGKKFGNSECNKTLKLMSSMHLAITEMQPKPKRSRRQHLHLSAIKEAIEGFGDRLLQILGPVGISPTKLRQFLDGIVDGSGTATNPAIIVLLYKLSLLLAPSPRAIGSDAVDIDLVTNNGNHIADILDAVLSGLKHMGQKAPEDEKSKPLNHWWIVLIVATIVLAIVCVVAGCIVYRKKKRVKKNTGDTSEPMSETTFITEITPCDTRAVADGNPKLETINDDNRFIQPKQASACKTTCETTTDNETSLTLPETVKMIDPNAGQSSNIMPPRLTTDKNKSEAYKPSHTSGQPSSKAELNAWSKISEVEETNTTKQMIDETTLGDNVMPTTVSTTYDDRYAN